jgi:hypothetical protein
MSILVPDSNSELFAFWVLLSSSTSLTLGITEAALLEIICIISGSSFFKRAMTAAKCSPSLPRLAGAAKALARVQSAQNSCSHLSRVL